MNITIELKKMYPTPREIAQVLWDNMLLAQDLQYPFFSVKFDKKPRERKPDELDNIISIVCGYFNIPEYSVQENTRKTKVVRARQICMYFAMLRKVGSLEYVGSKLCDRDHATVKHSVKTINNLIDTDARFREQIREIERRIG